MALNAHLALFDFDEIGDTVPGTGEDEAKRGQIAGNSGVVPTSYASGDVRWIVLSGIQFHVGAPGGDHSNVELNKERDTASPSIAYNCARQTNYKAAKILVLDSDNNIEEVIRLYGVRIQSVRATLREKIRNEAITLSYKQAIWNSGTVQHGWDWSANDKYPPPAQP